MKFSFGKSEYQRIEIDVLRYEQPAGGEYYNDNWLTTQIRIRAGGFRGKVDAPLLTGELAAFLAGLRPLYDPLCGTAEFLTMEDQLHLRLVGDGKGHVELTGEVLDQAGIGNRLHFTIQIDQSLLRAAIHKLERVTAEFPVRSV